MIDTLHALKPCPFCGEDPELIDTLPSGSLWYRCEGCGGETEGGKTEAEAIAAWNRRALSQPQAGEPDWTVENVNGKQWRITGPGGQWTMKPEGLISANEAKEICLRAAGVAPASPPPANPAQAIGDLPYPPIVICTDADGQEHRVGAHEYRTVNRPEGGAVTISIYMANHTWIEAQLDPQSAKTLADLILSKPCVKALTATLSQPANPAQVTDAMKTLRAELVEALDGHTKCSRDCSLSGEFLASQIWPLIAAAIGAGSPSTEAQIEHMVQQFLRWKLPDDFNPDGGVQFVKRTDYGHTFEPVGTNLFDYKQAKVMVQYMIEGLPAIRTDEPSAARPLHWIDVLREWFGGERYARDYEYLDANYSDHARRVAAYAASLSQPHPADERVVEALRNVVDLVDRDVIRVRPSDREEFLASLAIWNAALSGSGAGGWREIPVTDETVNYVMQYGGRCRDCADAMGVCPTSGLPCIADEARSAIRHTLRAVNFGMSNGYLPAAPTATGGR